MSLAIGRTDGMNVLRMPLLLRLALRDLRGGISGFGIFIGCIFLGVLPCVATNPRHLG